jgi:hypothetical protein
LTSTGINFGTNGFIVGVRGTSIALSKNATTTALAIVDSVKDAGVTAAEIRCRSGVLAVPKFSSGIFANATGTGYQTADPCPQSAQIPPPSPTVTDASFLYLASPWIQKNTLADIAYLADLSGTLAGTAQVKAATELDKTVPANIASNVPLATAYCPQNSGKMLWKSLEGTKHDLCQPIGLVAFADFSGCTNTTTAGLSTNSNINCDKNLYFTGGKIIPTQLASVSF